MDENELITPLTIDIAKIAIKERFPKLKIIDIKYLGGGSHSVFNVNNTYVFRFPKIINEVYSVADASNIFLREQMLIPIIKNSIEPHSSITQKYLSLQLSGVFNAPIAGYQLLTATPIYQLSKLELKNRNVAGLLGDLLSKLHSIPETNLPMDSLHKPNKIEVFKNWVESYQDAKKEIFPILQRDEREWFLNIFESFLQTSDDQDPNIVLAHNDFDPTNVMIDNKQDSLYLIDLDDINFGDSVNDFCIWMGEFGKDFVMQMLASYKVPIDKEFFNRALFYYNRIPLIYFSMGKRLHNQNFIDFGRTMLKKRMGK